MDFDFGLASTEENERELRALRDRISQALVLFPRPRSTSYGVPRAIVHVIDRLLEYPGRILAASQIVGERGVSDDADDWNLGIAIATVDSFVNTHEPISVERLRFVPMEVAYDGEILLQIPAGLGHFDIMHRIDVSWTTNTKPRNEIQACAFHIMKWMHRNRIYNITLAKCRELVVEAMPDSDSLESSAFLAFFALHEWTKCR